jgi:hypothetical protein
MEQDYLTRVFVSILFIPKQYQMKSLIIKIVVFVLLALFACWPYFEKFTEYTIFKRLWIGVCMCCLIAFGVWDIANTDGQLRNADNQATQDKQEIKRLLEKSEKEENARLNQLPLKVKKSIDSSLKKSNSSAKHSKPYALLDLSALPIGKTNPFFEKTSKDDSLIFNVVLSNWGTGFAFNINGTLQIVGKKSNEIFLGFTPKKSQINKQKTIPPDPHVGAPFTIWLQYVKNFRDSTFICIKFNFSDSTGVEKSIHRIFYSRADLSLQEASIDDEKLIEYFLIKNGYWKPPIKQ